MTDYTSAYTGEQIDDGIGRALSSIPASTKGEANGVASLDSNGKVSAGQASSRIVAKSDSFTLDASLSGCLVLLQMAATGRIVTVPTNASVGFPIGTEIEFVEWTSFEVSFAAENGVDIKSLDDCARTSGQYACVTLKKITTDTWLLAGALE